MGKLKFNIRSLIDYKRQKIKSLSPAIFICLLNNQKLNETAFIQIAFWILNSPLSKENKSYFDKIIKKSIIKNYITEIKINDINYEKNIRKILYKVLVEKQLELLCKKCNENFEKIKKTIFLDNPIEIEEDIEGNIIKYIQFLNSIELDSDSNKKNFFDYVEYISIINSNVNDIEYINESEYLNCLKEKWIISNLKEKNYSENIEKLLIKMFIKNNFRNNIIKNFIKIVKINNKNDLIKFYDFYDKNNINIDILSNILLSYLDKYISLSELESQIIYILIDKYEINDNISKKFAKIIYKNNKWDIQEIYKFIIVTKNIFNDLNKLQIDILEDTFNKIKFNFTKQNKEGENLSDILKKYDQNDWEYKIKQLGLPTSSNNERNIKEIFEDLLNYNSTIDTDLLRTMEQLSEIYYKYEYEFHKKRGELEKPIEKWEKEDIIKWTKSEFTKKNIGEDSFIPELLAVVCRANQISEVYLPRKVQIICILLFLFSPKNKGLFAQVKTGEGKTTIVSMLAVIKALRGKYVDILTSSEVLAERDANERKKFYSLFGLTVTHANNDHFHKYNIVYGDCLSFEGDILRSLFGKSNNSNIGLKRKQECIIIDEVDNICVDNLDSSTRLVSEFGGYGALNGIYPLIYQNLNIIDQYILEGKIPGINQNNIRAKTIEKLIDSTKEIINEGIKNKTFIFPEHIQEFAKNQIKNWCESAYDAKNIYKPDIDYVISQDKDGKRKISPADKNTGVIHLKMQWGNGLHQFLQLKHGLRLENETLNTTYLSHYIFIKKYITPEENNVYGLSGTLGRIPTQKLYKKLFNVNVVIVPTFRKSNFINLYPKLETSQEDWKSAIIENILNLLNIKRVILVICDTIEKAKLLASELKKRNYPECLIEIYCRNDDPKFKLKDQYGPGYVIFATNLAGRGTDIKLTDEVEKKGGMHVILTFLPKNQRIEEQALGRTARSGKNGSGIIIMEHNENNIVKKTENENGKEIIVNKKFDIISMLREKKEKLKIDYIENNKINSLQLKSEIFDKFTKLYQDLKLHLKKQGNEKNKINAIAKDLEEKWGLWLKQKNLDENIDFNEKEKIILDYNLFEEKIKKDYFKSSFFLKLLNPFNYFDYSAYSKAFTKDNNSCFFAQYERALKNIENIVNDSNKNNLKCEIENTFKNLQENLQTSLEGMYSTISNLHNTLSEEKEDLLLYNDGQKDVKDKLDIISKIGNGLAENLKVIENSLGNDKHVLYIEKYEYINKLTKDRDLINYFQSMKIYGYYIIKIEIKKDWFGIFISILVGALEIIGGCVLLWATGGQIGDDFIKEGFEDLKYGFECLLGKKEFSWTDFKKRKITFLIKTAINIAIKIITAGFSGTLNKFKPKAKLSNVVKQVAKKVVRKAGVEVGCRLAIHIIGPEFLSSIVNKVREIIKDSVIKYFGRKLVNKLKSDFNHLLCINITIYKGKNPIERILKEQIKIGISCFADLVELLVNLLLSLFSSNKAEALINIAKNGACKILKNSLKKGLESLLCGSISELSKLIKKKSNNGAFNNLISSWPDYLLKGAKVCQNIMEAEDLTSILVQNGVISPNGELNYDEVLDGENTKIKTNFKLDLGIFNKPIRNFTGKIKFPQKIIDIEEKISAFIDKIKFKIDNEIFENILSKSHNFFYNGINIINNKEEEYKNFIRFNIYSFKNKIFENSKNILYDLIKSINNLRCYTEKVLNDKFNEIGDIYNNFETKFNDSLNTVTNQIINKLSNFNIFDQLIKNININDIINIEKILNKIDKIFRLSLDYFIPIIKGVFLAIENEKLNKFIDVVDKIMAEIQILLKDSIIPVIEFIKNGLDEIKKNNLKNILSTEIKIKFNLIDRLNELKNGFKNINEKIYNKIIDDIYKIMDTIDNLDELLTEKVEDILNRLFKPFEDLKEKLSEISEKIEEKIISIKDITFSKLDQASHKIRNLHQELTEKGFEKIGNYIVNSKSIQKGLNSAIKGGNKFFKNVKNILKDKIKDPMAVINKLQSLCKGIEQYEQSSQSDVNFVFDLNEIIINKLLEKLMEALNNTKIGSFLKKGYDALLKEMESTKKCLKGELENMGVLPEK